MPRIIPQSADAIMQMARAIPNVARLHGTNYAQIAVYAMKGAQPTTEIDAELINKTWPRHLVRAVNTVAERQRFK